MSNRKVQLEKSWLNEIGDEFDKPYMQELRQFLRAEKATHNIYPPGPFIFNALNTTAFTDVKVVILGQDPYHGAGQAHGLSFSVPEGVNPPPSLQNIFNEVFTDVGGQYPGHGDLTRWAEQGVLLLNTTLTVREKQPQSHAGRGWEMFTDKIIQVLSQKRSNIVFMLWGKHAKTKIPLIDSTNHLVLTSSHPSPYSANYGFLGCRHFSTANYFLEERRISPIKW